MCVWQHNQPAREHSLTQQSASVEVMSKRVSNYMVHMAQLGRLSTTFLSLLAQAEILYFKILHLGIKLLDSLLPVQWHELQIHLTCFLSVILQWSQFDKLLGRFETSEPDPDGRVLSWEKASPAEIKERFANLGFKARQVRKKTQTQLLLLLVCSYQFDPKSICRSWSFYILSIVCWDITQVAVLSAFLGPDQVETEAKLATDPDIAPWVKKYQDSRRTVSQTDYEVKGNLPNILIISQTQGRTGNRV